MHRPVVIGIEGGGTHTRAMLTDLAGNVLAYAEAGGSHPGHNRNATSNVQIAIQQVLQHAECDINDVVSLVAGFSGLNEPDDHIWAKHFTEVPGLICSRIHVNDAYIAHRSIFRGRPGIIAIAGTGSMVFGVMDDGGIVRNADFGHYASASARHLAYEAVFGVLAGDAQYEDTLFVQHVLNYWEMSDIHQFREYAKRIVDQDSETVNRKFGEMAPLVTASASAGIPLAQKVCDAAVRSLRIGITLLGNVWADEEVHYGLIGSVARCPYIKTQLLTSLTNRVDKQYLLVEPVLKPVAGAVLLALDHLNVVLDDQLWVRLQSHPDAVFL